MDFNSPGDFGGDFSGSSNKLAHPGVTFCHLAFRSAALALYLFANMVPGSSFVGLFVAIVLLLSVDFWTVKNVTGRIMAGLRWWNYINDEGKSVWMFEARNGDSQHLLSNSEVRIFWAGLVLAPLLWAVFFLTALMGLKFQWLVLVSIGLALTTSNLLGYLRCRFGTPASGDGPSASSSSILSSAADAFVRQQMVAGVMSMFSRGQPQQQQQTGAGLI